ncbi:MAG: hypothetical protein ACOYNS_03155 [Bacteroidota bacterium]
MFGSLITYFSSFPSRIRIANAEKNNSPSEKNKSDAASAIIEPQHKNVVLNVVRMIFSLFPGMVSMILMMNDGRGGLFRYHQPFNSSP